MFPCTLYDGKREEKKKKKKERDKVARSEEILFESLI